jgi:hypothetical protein
VKTNIWKLLTVMVVLTMLVTGLAACAPTATPAPTEAPPAEATEAPSAEATEEPAEAEPVTLRVGDTTIWDRPPAGNPTTFATGSTTGWWSGPN